MRIRSGGPLAGAGPVGRREETRRSSAAPKGTSAPTDSASIMGVPEAELTPNVQRALLSLMGEVDQLRRETEALRSRMRDLESLADRDALLPVLNRRAFLREVSKALSLAERHSAPSSLIYMDLNGFKQINDQHGHAAGDAALEQVANLITDHVRETDAVGRLGGDEFGIVLTLTPESAARQKAGRCTRSCGWYPSRNALALSKNGSGLSDTPYTISNPTSVLSPISKSCTRSRGLTQVRRRRSRERSAPT